MNDKCTCKPNDPCYFHIGDAKGAVGGEPLKWTSTHPYSFGEVKFGVCVHGNNMTSCETCHDSRRDWLDDHGGPEAVERVIEEEKSKMIQAECDRVIAELSPVKSSVSWMATHTLTGHIDIDAFLEECLSTMRAKGEDYRQGDPDLLAAFRKTGAEMDLPMEKVWGVFVGKHQKAIANFIRTGGQSESEPIEGRIKDVIVYHLLFYKMVQEMKARSAKKGVDGDLGDLK